MDNKEIIPAPKPEDTAPKDRGTARFSLEYSAAEQDEIKKIVSKYTKRDDVEAPIDKLRRLDAGVYAKSNAVSIAVGVVGALVMGTGMSLAMTDIGESLGIWAMPLGILIGLLGIGLCALAYPIYHAVEKRERAKVAPEILRISGELIGSEEK